MKPELRERLKRIVFRALRHTPEEYGVSIDPDGWVEVPMLAHGICQRHPDLPITPDDIFWIPYFDSLDRFEVDGHRIRTLYGHSIPGIRIGQPALPPALLYHATSAVVYTHIADQGLLPVSRAFVHLTSSWWYSVNLYRNGPTRAMRIVFGILALDAAEAGISFVRANHHVWTCSYVPPKFLRLAVIDPGIIKGPSSLLPLDMMLGASVSTEEAELLFTGLKEEV